MEEGEIACVVASVISSSLNCLLLLDEKGDILEFNLSAEEAYGYFRSEVTGKSIWSLIDRNPSREEDEGEGSQGVSSSFEGASAGFMDRPEFVTQTQERPRPKFAGGFSRHAQSFADGRERESVVHMPDDHAPIALGQSAECRTQCLGLLVADGDQVGAVRGGRPGFYPPRVDR